MHAFEAIQHQIEEDSIDPNLALLLTCTCLPDAVHVGKSIKCSFHNWFVILGNDRACLSQIRTIRDNSSKSVQKEVRPVLKNGDAV